MHYVVSVLSVEAMQICCISGESEMKTTIKIYANSDLKMLYPDLKMLYLDLKMLYPDLEMLYPDLEMLHPDLNYAPSWPKNALSWPKSLLYPDLETCSILTKGFFLGQDGAKKRNAFFEKTHSRSIDFFLYVPSHRCFSFECTKKSIDLEWVFSNERCSILT